MPRSSEACAATAVPLLEARRLSRDFGGLRAVDSVSFRVAPGEIVGVIGPNGAGKTTLFSLLSGFLRPSGGEILFEGAPVNGHPPERLCRLGIARTFQVPRPFAEMTVSENVGAASVFGRPGRRSRSEIARETADLLDESGLAPVSDRPARTLSLAQRKRLEVARALATRPKVLLLDEVLAGLSPREVREEIPVIRRLADERGIAVLLIEHNLRAVMGLARRVLVLTFGRLIFDGTPADAVRNPDVVGAYLGVGGDA